MSRRPLSECEVKAFDPLLLIAAKVIAQAKADAERGDLSALAWLVTVGTDWAEKIAPGTEDNIVTFCLGILEEIGKGEIKNHWRGVLT